jgi:carbamoyl-phosphate synthase large subunit
MSDKVNILVTAVGSELAFSVIKAAKLIKFPLRIYGCDINTDVVGKYWCDGFRTVPPASRTDEYISGLAEMVRQLGIAALIPTADAEFEILAANTDFFLEELGCHVLVNPLAEVKRFTDKWEAHKWYKTQGIPAPRTYLADTPESVEQAARDLGFPMVLKPRIGGGSRHIRRVASRNELDDCLPAVPLPILQEYVYPDDEEYTAGTYRSRNGQIHVIVLKRMLKFGMTNIARSLTNRPTLEAFCREVIKRTNLVGSNNIQFRLGQDGPRVMEINARFSGTTGIRAHCGFNDLEMWLIDALELGEISSPRIRERLIMRYMEELYVDL